MRKGEVVVANRYRVLLTDYAWSDLEIERSILAESSAELIVAENGEEATLCELARDVDGIMTCWAHVSAPVIDAASRCRIVSRMGIGLDNIDVQRCSERGIPVTNVPDYCVSEVAEHTLALTFAMSRNVARFHEQTKRGVYDLRAVPTPRRIEGQTFGVIGYGNIGREVAKKAAALGMRVVAYSRRQPSDAGVATMVSFDDLIARSDFVSLHLPLAPETERIIGATELEAMPSTSFLINTARGGLVDHDALADALNKGQIAGAALDVQDPEPPDLLSPPYNDSRVIVTPHAAFVSVESVEALRRRASQQVVARLTGSMPANIVNPESLA